jgi:hypothetical protein
MELGVPEEDEEEPQPGTSDGGGQNLGLSTHLLVSADCEKKQGPLINKEKTPFCVFMLYFT